MLDPQVKMRPLSVTPEDEAFLEKQTAQKQQAVHFKTQLLNAQAQAQAQDSEPDPSQYASLREYRAANGTASGEVMRYYTQRGLKESIAQYDDDLAAQEKREQYADASDAELGTFTGQLKQARGAMLKTGLRMRGEVEAFLPTGQGEAILSKVDDDSKTIWGIPEEERTPEMDAWLDSPASVPSGRSRRGPDGKRVETKDQVPVTRRELLIEADEKFAAATATRDYYNNSATAKRQNPLNQDGLLEDLSATYQEHGKENFANAEAAYRQGDYAALTTETLAGVAKLAYNGAGDLANNPAATFEYIAEQIPQLIVGGYSTKVLAAVNLTYGSRIYSESIDKYREQNDGAYPSREDGQYMLGISLTAPLAEQIGQVKMLGALKGGSKAAQEATEEVVQGFFDKGIGKVAKSTVGGTAVEGATEIYQTAVEETFAAQGNYDTASIDGDGLFKAGAIGAAAGGGISGTGVTVSESRKALSRAGEELKKVQGGESQDTKEAVDVALLDGDVTLLVDPEDPGYAPARAVQVLNTRQIQSKERGLTEEDVVEEAKVLQDIISAQEAKVAELQAVEPKSTKKEQREHNKEQKTQERILGQMQGYIEAGQAELRRKSMPVNDANIELVKSEKASPERDDAAVATINLMMEDPDYFSDEDFDALQKSSAFTDEQKKQIAVFSRKHAAINALQTKGKVHEDVLEGRLGFKGLYQYQREAKTAIDNNDSAVLDNQVAKLQEFHATHQQKLDAFRKGIALQESAPEGQIPRVHIWQSPEGWQMKTGKTAPWGRDRIAQGEVSGFTMHPGGESAANVTTEINAELEAIKATELQIQEMRKAKFDTPLETSVNEETSANTRTDESTTTQQPTSTEVVSESVPQREEGDPGPGRDEDADSVAAPASANATPEPELSNTTEEVDIPTEIERLERYINAETDANVTDEAPNTTTPEATPEAEAQPVAEEAEPTEKTPPAPGRLTILKEVYVKAKDMTAEKFRDPLTNLLATYFTQRDLKEGDIGNPLVEVADFIGSMVQDGKLNFDLVRQYTKDLEDTSTPEAKRKLRALSQFHTFYGEVAQTIANNLIQDPYNRKGEPLKPEYNYKELTRFLVKNGEVDENVVGAIAFGAFQWLVENGGGQGINDLNTIRNLMNIPKNDPNPHSDIIKRLSFVGDSRNLVANSIGTYIYDALGLSEVPGAPDGIRTQLTIALGGQAITALLQEGYVTPTSAQAASDSLEDGIEDYFTEEWQDADFISEMSNNLESANKYADSYGLTMSQIKRLVGFATAKLNGVPYEGIAKTEFIRAARYIDFNGKHHPIEKVATIVDAGKETQGFLAKLFGVQESIIAPQDKPGNYKQKTTQRSRSVVSDFFKKIGKQVASQEHFVREDMAQVREYFSEENIGLMQGKSDPNKPMHKANEAAVAAKDAAIDRGIAYMKEYVASREAGKPFFLTPQQWKMQRVGLLERLINPQSDTYQRHNIYMGKHKVDVEFGTDMENNFLLAVAQGMNIKVEQAYEENVLADVAAKMAEPENKAAIRVLRNMQTFQPGAEGVFVSSEDQALVVKAVALGKEKALTLSVLVQYAQYETAKTEGLPFSSTLMYEVDGVANGPALAQIMMGLIEGGDGGQFGFFTNKQQNRSFVEYISQPSNRDLYESIAAEIHGRLKHSNNLRAVNALLAVTGHLMKVDGDGNFTDKVDSKGRKLTKGPISPLVFGSSMNRAVQAMADDFPDFFYGKIKELVAEGNLDQINHLIKDLNVHLKSDNQINSVNNLDEALERTLTNAQTKALVGLYRNVIGKPTEKVLDRRYKTFMERRKQLNNAAQASFAIYKVAFDHLVKLRVQAKINDETMPVSGANEVPNLKLSKEELDAIREELKDLQPIVHTPMSLADGNLAAGYYMMKQSRALSNEDPFKQRLNTKAAIPSSRGRSTHSMELRGSANEEVSPGVATMPAMIHSLDSYIAALTYGKIPALNVHDGVFFGINNINAGAKLLNKSTYQALTEYSVPMEILAAFERSLAARDALIEKAGDDTELIVALEAVANTSPTDLKVLREAATKAEIAKLEYLLTVEAVDQYPKEGGTYEVTAEARQKVSDRLAEIAGAAPEATTETEPLREEKPSELPEDTPWGILSSDSVVASDSDLEYAVSRADNVRQLITAIVKKIDAGSSDFNKKLLREIAKVVDPETSVRLIHGETKPPIKNLKTARGWYIVNESGSHIGIKSSEFKYSGITPELLLHEMTHAALAQIITNPMGYAVKTVQELEELLELVREHVKTNKLKGFKPALKNVDEMVAWGMTNPKFQAVLQQITIIGEGPDTLANTTKKSGLRAFIESLTELIFGNKADENYANGLGALIAHTGVLFEAAQENKPEGQATIKLTMDEEVDPMAMNSHEVLNALPGNTSSTRMTELHDLLSRVTEAAFRYDGSIKAAAERSTPLSSTDRFLDALANNKIPDTGSTLLNSLSVNKQEGYVLDFVELATREGLLATSSSAHLIRKELARVFREAREATTAADFYDGDFAQASKPERDLAEQAYADVFTVGPDYLSRFVAAALVHKPLSDRLRQVPAENTEQGGLFENGILEGIKRFFSKIMTMVSRRYVTKLSEGQNLVGEIDALASSLAAIEGKHKEAIKRQEARPYRMMENILNGAADKTKTAVAAVAGAKILKENKNLGVRALSKMAETTVEGRVGRTIEILVGVSNQTYGNKKFGVLGEVVNEVQGARDETQRGHEQLAKAAMHEKSRIETKIETSSRIVKEFGSYKLSEQQSKALTRMLRMDLPSLLKHYPTMEELLSVISGPKKLAAEIKAFEDQLTGPESDRQIIQAKTLAWHMVTGETVGQKLVHNSYNIAYPEGKSFSPQVEAAAKATDSVIDPLITLYALKMETETREGGLDVVTQMMADQNSRTDGNGVEYLLKVQQFLTEQAKKDIFDGEERLMVKGYIKEITDPDIDVLSGDDSAGNVLRQAGYKKLTELPQDPADKSKGTKSLYIIRDRGLPETITGFMNVTSEQSRGTVAEIGPAKARAIAAESKMNGRSWDPSKQKNTGLASPILNDKGEVVEWRYLMNQKTRMAMDPDGTGQLVQEVMGQMASSILDKTVAPKLNKEGIDILRAQYEQDYLRDPDAYIKVGPNSSDPVIAERYRTLPKETRRYIKKVWGRDTMLVRKDMYLLGFGNRKISLANAFSKEKENRNNLEKIMVRLLGAVDVPQPDGTTKPMGSKRALGFMRAENVWQQIVRAVKDIWVIKNLVTLVTNETSNMTVLRMYGVSPLAIIKGKVTAWNATLDYQKDRRKMDALQEQLDAGDYVVGKARVDMEQEILQLKNQLELNPVSELIDAAMYQTLVEDIAAEDDPYSYKSRLTRWAGDKTAWVPQPVKTVGKTIAMTHDTPLYKLLNHATMMSDFTSRYTLHQHLTTRKHKPLSKEESLRTVRAAFVNYDVPTHPVLQYLNDMGVLWFTKYYLRVQAVIFSMVRDNPTGVLEIMTLNAYLGGISDILDSSVVNKTPGNLGKGALEYPSAIWEMLTLKVLGAAT